MSLTLMQRPINVAREQWGTVGTNSTLIKNLSWLNLVTCKKVISYISYLLFKPWLVMHNSEDSLYIYQCEFIKPHMIWMIWSNLHYYRRKKKRGWRGGQWPAISSNSSPLFLLLVWHLGLPVMHLFLDLSQFEVHL